MYRAIKRILYTINFKNRQNINHKFTDYERENMLLLK